MKIPKKIRKRNSQYIFVKEYKDFVMYENVEGKYKECFNKQELNLIKEQAKPPRSDLNVERVKA